MSIQFAVLALGLWLAGAQGFAAEVCCSEMSSPKAACGNCTDQTDSPRPDCCTPSEAPEDIDAPVSKNDLSEKPLVVTFLTQGTSFAPRRPESADLLAQRAASRAEGPPLYLRYEVFLI